MEKMESNDQVVGMRQTYDYGLKFITIKGAGHYVNEDQPKVSKILLDEFFEFNGIQRKPNPEPDPTSNKTPEPENKADDSFPVWAIILISVGGLIFIILIVLIILKTRKRNTNKDIEENIKLVSESNEE